jgi:hypothetical protein
MSLLSSFFFNRSLDGAQMQEIIAASRDRMLGWEVCRSPGMAATMARYTGGSATVYKLSTTQNSPTKIN